MIRANNKTYIFAPHLVLDSLKYAIEIKRECRESRQQFPLL